MYHKDIMISRQTSQVDLIASEVASASEVTSEMEVAITTFPLLQINKLVKGQLRNSCSCSTNMNNLKIQVFHHLTHKIILSGDFQAFLHISKLQNVA